jgi:catechol 2,3-dioxygenase-like lactoylglutathione lyase family enzyme
MKCVIGLIGVLAVWTVSPAIADDDVSSAGMLGIKLAVKDFQRSIDFYTMLGMVEGTKYNPAEQELKWNSALQGSNIILVHDETGRSQLTPGTAALLIREPDVAATAKKLKDSGYPDVGTPRGTKVATILMLKDPDGNQIEMVGSPAK